VVGSFRQCYDTVAAEVSVVWQGCPGTSGGGSGIREVFYLKTVSFGAFWEVFYVTSS